MSGRGSESRGEYNPDGVARPVRRATALPPSHDRGVLPAISTTPRISRHGPEFQSTEREYCEVDQLDDNQYYEAGSAGGAWDEDGAGGTEAAYYDDDPYYQDVGQSRGAPVTRTKTPAPAPPRPTRVLWLGLFTITVALVGLTSLHGSSNKKQSSSTTVKPAPTTVAVAAPVSSTTSTLPPDGKTAAQRTMVRQAKITEGGLRPKSVVYSGGDYFFAQNMMYAHTITVYDRSFRLVKVISDSVDLGAMGQSGYSGSYQGAPVEAAFTSDGKYAYVSQYQMYGQGFTNPGDDSCPGKGNDDSFVYRVSTETLAIDQVIKVGAVPKYVAVTPDNSKVLVTNWCTYDMSIIDTATGMQTSRIELGRFPRGIVVSADSKTAYVAIMGGSEIAIVDLASGTKSWIANVGDSPRHLVMSPDGSTLYATLNGDGKVAKIDIASRSVVARKTTGAAPRSMAISDDGTALYVVNYNEDTVSKVATSDLSEISKLPTDHHPIGVTYDPVARKVWVACYVGSLLVFSET